MSKPPRQTLLFVDDHHILYRSGIGLATIPRGRFAGIGVEILTERGLRIQGFAKEDARPITGDALDHPVAWKDRVLADLGPGRFIVRIHLDRATVYAADLVEAG